MVFMLPLFPSVPAYGGFVEVDEDLLGFDILFETPGTEFAAEAGLLVAAPRCFDIGRLHVIDPDDSRAERFHDAESFINVTGPHGGGKPISGVVRDANGFRFAVEGNDGSNGAKDFFTSDAGGVLHVVENRRLNVVTFAKLLGAAAADRDFCFLLAEIEVGSDAVVLLFADERTHLRVAFKRSAKFDALGLFGHSIHELGINLFVDKNAAARRAHFALIDEHTEQRAIHGRFPIGVGKENVWGFATKFESDTLERIRGTLDDDFSDGRAAGEGDFVNVGMSDKPSTRGFAKAVDDVDDTGRQPDFFEPVGKFERGERCLLGGFEDASATSGDRGSELPGGHEQRIVPGNDLAGDADWFAKGEAERVGGNGVDVTGDFRGQAAVILETGGHVSDVEFRFDDGLAGVAAFKFGELRGVLADLFGELEKNAAAVLGVSASPGAGVECRAGGLDGLVDVGGVRGGDLSDHLFARRVVNGERFPRGAADPLAMHIILIGANAGFGDAGNHFLLGLRTG